MVICKIEEAQTYSTNSQVKCARYWPEKLNDSLTVEDKFSVTFSSNMPFAEYEFRKLKLENVSLYHLSSSHSICCHPLSNV